MQRIAKLVDLEKCFPMSIWLQKLASIQRRTSTIKFDHLVEKSEQGSVSNLLTKAPGGAAGAAAPAKDAKKKKKQ